MNRIARYLVLGIALSGLFIAGCGGKKKSKSASGGTDSAGTEKADSAEKSEKSEKSSDNTKTPGTTNEAPADQCDKACDNALAIAMVRAQEKLAEMPPDMQKQMLVSLNEAKASGKIKCFKECKTADPAMADCVVKAKTMDDMEKCAEEFSPPAGTDTPAPAAAPAAPAKAPAPAAPAPAAPAKE